MAVAYLEGMQGLLPTGNEKSQALRCTARFASGFIEARSRPSTFLRFHREPGTADVFLVIC
jgi:hypothetical protein